MVTVCNKTLRELLTRGCGIKAKKTDWGPWILGTERASPENFGAVWLCKVLTTGEMAKQPILTKTKMVNGMIGKWLPDRTRAFALMIAKLVDIHHKVMTNFA